MEGWWRREEEGVMVEEGRGMHVVVSMLEGTPMLAAKLVV